MRRTKEEAALTRDAIVDAALRCFDEQGIAHATLDGIAAGAGVTKGAVYHHFKGKGEILHEIRERVSLPLLDTADTTLLAAGPRPPARPRALHEHVGGPYRAVAFELGIVHGLQGVAQDRACHRRDGIARGVVHRTAVVLEHGVVEIVSVYIDAGHRGISK